MKTISELKDEQRGRFQEWVDKWIAIGLSTEPANFDAAEEGIVGCYQAAGLKPPRVVVCAGSPLAAVIAGPLAVLALHRLDAELKSRIDSRSKRLAMIATGKRPHCFASKQVAGCDARRKAKSPVDPAVHWSVRSAVGFSVHSAVYSAVNSAVESAVHSSVRSAVGFSVRSAVGFSVQSAVQSAVRSVVESAVHSSVRSAVGFSVRSAVRSAVESAVGLVVESAVGSAVHSAVHSAVDSADFGRVVRSVWHQRRGGNLWAGWYAFVSFFQDVCGWENEVLDAFKHDKQVALNSGWSWYHEEVAVISDRPKSISLDGNTLHNEEGPSIEYRDGWKLWHIDGIAVDEQIVMRPETQTVEQINQEENADVRAIRIARFGWPRYLKETNAACIDFRDNDIEGTKEALYRTTDGAVRMVATCPTGRVFSMGVDEAITTCAAAAEWLQGEKPFRVLGRT